MITYWLRVHCHWIMVTTSVAVWAATPHAAYDVACNAAGWFAPSPVEAFVPQEVEVPAAPIPVPEPGTFAILAAGVVLLAGLRAVRR